MAKPSSASNTSAAAVLRKKRNAGDSSWIFWAIVAALVVLASVLWSKVWPARRAQGHYPEKEEHVEDGLDAIREALTKGADGRVSFVEDSQVDENGSRTTSSFGKREYWENRYTKSKQDHFDWYGTWTHPTSPMKIKPLVSPWMPLQVKRILNVGCGDSRLAEELLNDGFSDIVSIDIAQSAIDKMSQKFAGVAGLSFEQMDATKMSFPDSSFDVVFDKGTLDAFYTGNAGLVPLTVAQVFRVLQPGGLFVSVTFGPPKGRKALNFTNGIDGALPGWERFHMTELRSDTSQPLFVYLMMKPS